MFKNLEQPNTPNKEQKDTEGGGEVDPQEILNRTTTILNELRERKAQIEEQTRMEVVKKLTNRENLIKQSGEKVESLEQARNNLDTLILESKELLNGLGEKEREVFEAQRSEIERLIASLEADLRQIDEQIKEIEEPEVIDAMQEEATGQNVRIDEALDHLEQHQTTYETALTGFSSLQEKVDGELAKFEERLKDSGFLSEMEDLKHELTKKQNSTFFMGRDKREARVAEIKDMLRKRENDLLNELRNITQNVYKFISDCEESFRKFYYNVYNDADKSGSTALKETYDETKKITDALIKKIETYLKEANKKHNEIKQKIDTIFEIKKS